MKKWLSLAIGVLVSAAIFVALIGSDLTVITEELQNGNYIYLIPGSLVFIAGVWTRAIRWRAMLDDNISLSNSFHIINIGYFLSGILPLRLGDLARAWLTSRLEQPIPSITSLSTIVAERLLDLLAVLMMLGFSLLLLDVPSEVASAGALLGVGAIIASILLVVIAARPKIAYQLVAICQRMLPFSERFPLETLVEKVLSGIQPLSRPNTAARIIFWTAISWGLSILAGYVFLFTIFESPTLSATLAFIVLASFSVALPAVPGNLGPFEGAVVGGLWIGGLIETASSPENAPAVAFAAILHAITLALYIVLGLIGLYVQQTSIRQITVGSEQLSGNNEEPEPAKGLANSKHLTDILHERAS